MQDTIAVRDLQVGMFVHLDLGWMSHPFPRSSFHIASVEQIAVLRSLGLGRVRWSPERSLPGEGPVTVGLTGALPMRPAMRVAPSPAESAEAPDAQQQPSGRSDPGPAPAARAAAAQCCEQRYAAAGEAVSAIVGNIVGDPQRARSGAEALARTLLDDLQVDKELSIRLLGEPYGDPDVAHALNVTVIALLLGRVLGLDETEMEDLGVGALLHDAGRVDLPERLRRPDDSFSAAERHSYRNHVALGVAHGRRMGLTPGALLVVAQHHENADGSGFPLKLVADRMSVPARIMALVDRFDMLCNPGPQGRKLTPHEALSLMFAQCRTQYDATMLNAFIRMVGVYPAGSVVQLTDDRFGLVVGVNSSRPLKPRVLVHDPAVPREQALALNLETAVDLGIRRSLQPQALPAPAFAYLAPPQRVGYYFEAPPAAVTQDRQAASA